MKIPSEIIDLVERFGRNIDTYKRDDYKETRVRVEFIDPFFEALGWDVRNVEGRPEQYKDVVHEDTVSIAGKTRAPDYSFRVGGARKFFLEAKKPSVDIKDNIAPAYQLRRYSWSVNLPIGVLTDFEEFAVYDCRYGPKLTDKSSIGKLLYLTFDQYLERYDEIYDLFSKQSVLSGSLDQYTQTLEGTRGAVEVDKELLKEIEGWRDVLARNIALRNENLSVHELNYSVQRTIDRIIFLRMAEDRGIEVYGYLREIAAKTDIYPRLTKFYKQADDKYNAGLFDFNEDTLTHGLIIDDKVLKPILDNLYYPKSPYEFSVLPVEILGQVYEQFLGKVIRLTPGHRAKIEEKPEVKKAGGVYYTPNYIVNYIVRNTVGKLVSEKAPKQINNIRIVDPSCGSGSFLLGAYQYLLDYHLIWYQNHEPTEHSKKKHPPVYLGSMNEWRLTTYEKKRILLNNIYGVDIDRQAVEVSKLSLLLQVLEGETDESLGQQLSLWQERALPDLGNNIKCGNSLIGPEYFQSQLIPDDNEMRRVNPFDWDIEFHEIFENGGFDCVLGNPPWVQSGLILDFKDYFKSLYDTYTGNSDLYVYFIERSLRLMKAKSHFGMIISNKWLRSNYGDILRSYLSQKTSISQLIDFGELPVFKGVGTFPCILLCRPKEYDDGKTTYTPIKGLPPKNQIDSQVEELGYLVDLSNPDDTNWTLVPPEVDSILNQMRKIGTALGEYCKGRIRRGVVTGYNPAFIIDEDTRNRLIKEDPSADQLIKPFVSGKETRRYSLTWQGRYIIFTRRDIDISNYPSVLSYLSNFKDNLLPKNNHKDKMGRKPGHYKWYEIQDSTSYFRDFEKPKIIYGQFQIAPHFCFSPSTLYFGSNHYMILLDDLPSMYYLLGILNSNLYFFYMKRVAGVLGDVEKKGRLITQKSHMLKFPVRTIDLDEKIGITCKNRIIFLVEQMLDLNQKSNNASVPADKELYKRQIDNCNRQIDPLVYELYGLTKEDIKIVDNS